MKKESHSDHECPVRSILASICSKWSILILDSLDRNGTMRFNQISHELGDISQKMLSATLKTLVSDGIISRKMYEEIPPRVEYELTTLGKELIPNVRCLINWATNNLDKILDNRNRHNQ